jgi:nitrile hydratase subunit beta
MNALPPGARVRIADRWPERGPGRVHVRTPAYLRGRDGVVEGLIGAFADPETLAFGGDGLPKKRLYRVRFAASVFARAGARDSLVADIFEHWLEPAP